MRIKHPVTGKIYDSDFHFIKNEFYRIIESLITIIIDESNDYTICIPCGDTSQNFRKKSGLLIHLRTNPKHIVNYFIKKSRVYRVEGRCCENEPRFEALINNEPLEIFIVQLCSTHVNEEMYTKNAIKIEKISEEN